MVTNIISGWREFGGTLCPVFWYLPVLITVHLGGLVTKQSPFVLWPRELLGVRWGVDSNLDRAEVELVRYHI